MLNLPNDLLSIAPTCRPDQVFNSCGSQCTPTCTNPTPPCIFLCVARCECPSGHVVGPDDVCIPQSECPGRFKHGLSEVLTLKIFGWVVSLGRMKTACWREKSTLYPRQWDNLTLHFESWNCVICLNHSFVSVKCHFS